MTLTCGGGKGCTAHPNPKESARWTNAGRWHELTIESERQTQLVDITDEVRELVRDEGGTAVVIFVPHTTAGIVLQASGPDARRVAADIESTFDRLIDESWPSQHTNEGDQNPWSHARSALTASSITIPLENGDLGLGELQRIFLCEFDGPRNPTRPRPRGLTRSGRRAAPGARLVASIKLFMHCT